MYVRTSYVHRRDSDKTYASCWLARVVMPKAYSDYTKQVVIYVPPPPGPTGQYIAKIAAGGNQGNRTRNHQVLSEICCVGVGRKEARELKTFETERTVQRNGPWNGTE